MAWVCGNKLLHVGWVAVMVGAKNPSSSRDLGRFERVEVDAGANTIKLGLAVGGKEFCFQIKAQENRNEKRWESIAGESEAIKVFPKLRKGVPQGRTQFEDLRFFGKGETIGEDRDGAIHLEEFIHGTDQGVAITTHMVQAHSVGVWDDEVKV